ncbi:hypothetical protein [Streptomyces sp. NPDC093591]|uniref:hypothetical protein n=1 Tax=Streptomyces sp. NPDC093591 TaxID=3366044 RepID=UPI00381E626F
MTEIESAEKAPLQPLPSPESAPATDRPWSTARLVGVDLARAVAVFGMFAVHVGPFNPFPTSGDDVGTWSVWLASGRASALFGQEVHPAADAVPG